MVDIVNHVMWFINITLEREKHRLYNTVQHVIHTQQGGFTLSSVMTNLLAT